MASMNFGPRVFKCSDANPIGTLELYIERMSLVFKLAFCKADGTPYESSDKDKKAMLPFPGGDNMKDLFQHVGAVETKDTYNEALTRIHTGLQNCTNSVVQRNLLFASFPQGTKFFEK